MAYVFKFDKILYLKEKEKGDALSDYQSAVHKFEEAAQRLYELLKRKEDIQAYQLPSLPADWRYRKFAIINNFLLIYKKVLSIIN